MSRGERSKRDEHNRSRQHTVAFRMDDQEWQAFLERVELSGHQRQDYLIKSALHQELVVIGNGALFRKLNGAITALVDELKRIEGITADDVLSELRIKTLIEILDSLHHDERNGGLDDLLANCADRLSV